MSNLNSDDSLRYDYYVYTFVLNYDGMLFIQPDLLSEILWNDSIVLYSNKNYDNGWNDALFITDDNNNENLKLLLKLIIDGEILNVKLFDVFKHVILQTTLVKSSYFGHTITKLPEVGAFDGKFTIIVTSIV